MSSALLRNLTTTALRRTPRFVASEGNEKRARDDDDTNRGEKQRKTNDGQKKAVRTIAKQFDAHAEERELDRKMQLAEQRLRRMRENEQRLRELEAQLAHSMQREQQIEKMLESHVHAAEQGKIEREQIIQYLNDATRQLTQEIETQKYLHLEHRAETEKALAERDAALQKNEEAQRRVRLIRDKAYELFVLADNVH